MWTHTSRTSLFRHRNCVHFEVVPHVDELVATADVVISLTTSDQPVIREPIRSSATYFHFSGHECTYEFVDRIDRIYVDDWKVIAHRANLTPARMYDEGCLAEERTAGNLGELVASAVPGRTGDELIMFCAMGMAIEDIAVAQTIYRESARVWAGEAAPVVERS